MRIALLIWIAALIGGPAAQAAPQTPAPPPRPTIILSVTLPSGTLAKVGVPSGDRATVGLANGPHLGLIATLVEDGRLELVIVDISTDAQTGSEVVRELDRRFLEIGEPVRFEHEVLSLTITWIETRRVSAPTADTLDPCKICCVYCQGEQVCACHVDTPCGRCCCPATCSCDLGARPAAGGGTALTPIASNCIVAPGRR